MTRFAPVVLVFGLVLGCADTNAPPPDPIELFAVVNTQANSVTIDGALEHLHAGPEHSARVDDRGRMDVSHRAMPGGARGAGRPPSPPGTGSPW